MISWILDYPAQYRNRRQYSELTKQPRISFLFFQAVLHLLLKMYEMNMD